MRRLAAFSYTKRWYVLGGWIVLLVLLTVVSAIVAGKYRTDFELPGSESQHALDLLKERGAADRTGISTQLVFKSAAGYDDPAVKARMEQFFSDIQAQVPDVSLNSPYDPANAFQVSADKTIAYAELNLGKRSQEEYVNDADTIKGLWEQIDVPGLQVELGGDTPSSHSPTARPSASAPPSSSSSSPSDPCSPWACRSRPLYSAWAAASRSSAS